MNFSYPENHMLKELAETEELSSSNLHHIPLEEQFAERAEYIAKNVESKEMREPAPVASTSSNPFRIDERGMDTIDLKTPEALKQPEVKEPRLPGAGTTGGVEPQAKQPFDFWSHSEMEKMIDRYQKEEQDERNHSLAALTSFLAQLEAARSYRETSPKIIDELTEGLKHRIRNTLFLNNPTGTRFYVTMMPKDQRVLSEYNALGGYNFKWTLTIDDDHCSYPVFPYSLRNMSLPDAQSYYVTATREMKDNLGTYCVVFTDVEMTSGQECLFSKKDEERNLGTINTPFPVCSKRQSREQ